MDKKIRGNFRPKPFVIKPKIIFPIIPPKHSNEAIQLASSILILPVGRGDSSDVRTGIKIDVHPHVIPWQPARVVTTTKIRNT